MFFDSNVLIDVLSRDPRWSEWSSDQIVTAGMASGGVMNVVVLAELSSGYASVDEICGLLRSMSLRIQEMSEDVAFQAGQAFARWRHARNVEQGRRVLADFLIGAHARLLGMPLVTRDPPIYRRYFPDLPLITPETHP